MTENEIYYQNLIYLYLDGEASDAEQKVLFDQMANNSALQEEFSKAMELNKAMVEDREFLAPSLELTQKVFDKAGFISNSELVQYPHAGASIIRKLIYNSRTVLQTIGSGLVAASILFTGYTIIEKFDKNIDNIEMNSLNKIEENLSINRLNTNIPTPNTQNNTIPMVSSVETVSPISTKLTEKNRKVKHTELKINKNNAFASAHNSSNIANANTIVDSVKVDDDLPPIAENSVRYETPYMLNHARISTVKYDVNKEYPTANQWFNNEMTPDLNLSFRINGITGLAYYPSRDIEHSGEALNNFSINVSYHFGDNHSFGLNVGKEALQLYDVKQDGKKFTFERQPNILWAGASYRYSFGELFDLVPISPYTELSIGGTKYGPIGKFSLGMNYNLSNSIEVGFGYEFTSLAYTEFSTYKITNKSGLIYNLTYKLK